MPTKKTERLQLRFSPEEKKMLIEKSAEARMTVSDYIAALVENKKITVVENIPDLIYEVRKIGVNINQIAHIANSQRYIDNELLTKAIQGLNEIKSLVQKILSEVYNADEHTIKSLERKINELIERVDNFGNSQGN